MQRKAKADIIVAERARKIGEERKQPLVEVATITTYVLYAVLRVMMMSIY